MEFSHGFADTWENTMDPASFLLLLMVSTTPLASQPPRTPEGGG
jgi:hypothetical protein